MRSPLHFAIVLLGLVGLPAAGKVEPAEVARRFEESPTAHPRLFLSAGDETALRQRISAEPVMGRLFAEVRREAESQLATPPVMRVQIGRRLLDKSRTCLSRILHLGLAWRVTGETKYLERARSELLAVAAFSDWNPKHFLDVAEMTAAVGIGYDWLYPALDEPTRRTLRQAIIEKGLQPSLTTEHWTRATNNWNQVCNAGVTVGALALAESEPELAARIVARAVNTVPVSMHEYSPDGAYPEGPSYWAYGTTFNVILISALQSALGTDFGLAQEPGFLATADYYLHVTGPSGYFFNYADAGHGGSGLAPAMFWFAARRGEPYLLSAEWAKLQAETASRARRERTAPFALIWAAPGASQPSTPPALSWTGRGANPVAFHRSSWGANATYVALKGGSPSTSHAHMDVGSFVMDADGERWADDLGMQDYESLESKGIKLWDRTQTSDRWKVFRLGTSSHSVLMVDGQPQRVEGHAPIVLAKPNRTVVDLVAIYRGQLAAVQRGVALCADRSVLVQDEFRTTARPAAVRWAMVTRAEVKLSGAGRATLTQAGRTLRLEVAEPTGATLKIYPTDPPPAASDARNPGTRLVGFEMQVPADAQRRIVVRLAAASTSAAVGTVEPLARW